MKQEPITFNNVVKWLTERQYPRDEAIRLCKSNLRNGLIILNKIKAYDKMKNKVEQGQQWLFEKWK